MIVWVFVVIGDDRHHDVRALQYCSRIGRWWSATDSTIREKIYGMSCRHISKVCIVSGCFPMLP